jgi:prepilin-type N-terminal cleavage/methylation domain-containing protein
MNARPLRMRAATQHGYSLVELLVSISILAVVLAMATQALAMTTRVVGDNASRLDQGQQAKVAMESMSQVLRTAILPKQLSGTCTGCDTAAFITGDGTSVQFYANVNNDLSLPTSGTTTFGPRRVTYNLTKTGAQAGTLTETLQLPDAHAVTDFNFTYCAPGPTCAIRTRVLARNVVTTSAIFTYYDKNGTALTVPLSATNLASVDSIDLVVTVKIQGRVEGTTVTTRVMLPNADSLIQPTASST